MSTLSHAPEPFQPTLAFYFAPWYRQRRVIETPLTTEQCRERLGACVMSQRDARRGADVSGPPDERFLVGRLWSASFAVSRNFPRRPATGPMVLGRFEEGSLGTRVLLSVMPNPSSAVVGWWLLFLAALSIATLALALSPGHPLGALDSMVTLGIASGVLLAPIGIVILGIERRKDRQEWVALPEDIRRLLKAPEEQK